MQPRFLMSEMTWPEIQEALQRTDIVLLPVGATEQHGPHLPLNNDIFTSFEISKRTAERLLSAIPVLVAPPLPIGVSPHHMSFPGTLTLQTRTFIEVVKEVARSLASHGFKNLIIVNGHGGNTNAIQIAADEIVDEMKVRVLVVEWWNLVPDVIAKLFAPPFYHACETETSMALALGQRIDSEKVKASVPTETSKFVKHDFLASGPKVYEPLHDMKEITKLGPVGDPTRATKEKGTELLEAVVERFVSLIKEVKLAGH
jgi:creatinine amidohydrolase